jgi:hypothetical protein
MEKPCSFDLTRPAVPETVLENRQIKNAKKANQFKAKTDFDELAAKVDLSTYRN